MWLAILHIDRNNFPLCRQHHLQQMRLMLSRQTS